ncbi:DUF3597 domain-containing protein [Devosia ginsengisoli]|uniref:DUF3597 domain-containing protein n=1 Tax=Devosia ginsengisoli TaxID=400770 RepID=UPI0026ECD1ED|nr:DUF3597 domain-containing protein [Devosia ginsengisoli]MCR6673938.1 DUF3597 domain-containing protein [Devosia ginsengisoli]
MSLFDSIKSRIFGTEAPAGVSPATSATTPTPAASPEAKAAQQAALDAGMAAANKAIADAVAANAAAAKVDVAAVLDAAVAKSGQKLNWKTSIVDLMKALDLDSSLTARKQLADELGYTGDKSDSAAMNIWLHKQVLAKLAANGGKVPESLLA